MTVARLITASPALILGASVIVLFVLVVREDHRARRANARAAERRARPHSAHVGTAAEDAAAILNTAIQEQQP
ncbi:hypothetical protein HRW18_05565 [Streptomyces lunaelactis]|uniref:hypothetical protein n=1 Tax=Streptomyces lunaelactis TaxID=1535768 RepID=UPI0015851CA3|nr:hypothetical protein [Streptomyces lunaelactis]NUK07490.1 hypothetical protein [Streptomyces lunaelactis]